MYEFLNDIKYLYFNCHLKVGTNVGGVESPCYFFFFIFVSYKVKQWLPVMPDEVSQFVIKMT